MGNEHTEYIEEVEVPVEAIQAVDPAVAEKLPPGIQIEGISEHGASFWTRTARLDTTLDGVMKSFFLKCHTSYYATLKISTTSFGERGRKMMSGEYHCMNKIHAVVPDLVPETIAWGSYSDIPDVHFFLAEFRPMTDELPDVEVFPARMAELHRTATSPDGKFGFDFTTFHGNTPIEHGWSDTWEDYFTRTTKVLLELEQEAQGPNEEIRGLMVPFFGKVVPRLLRPLETGGRSIQPSLIHGDLWDGNASMDSETEMPIIFDAASFYAHNEYELGVWRQPWNKIKKPYRMRYHKHFPKSQPEEDYDDRNVLYATRVNILDSILYKGDPSYREMLINGMKGLVDKFPGGLEEWEGAQTSRSY
ncbi:hypothetical protein PG994_005023 [Apiospora phragmitis]|uniref:protein-ribulosamine 3-kinase n=1 Tax=Apiospora phragmitis TaxID=2905665 RepID=A0ABR1VS92_9PEZI